MFAFLLPLLPSFAAIKLYALGAVILSAIVALGTLSIVNRVDASRTDRANRTAINAALDNAQEIARRQSAHAASRAQEAAAANANITELQGMLADAHLKSTVDLARCITPVGRVRILRAILAGDTRKGQHAAARAR